MKTSHKILLALLIVLFILGMVPLIVAKKNMANLEKSSLIGNGQVSTQPREVPDFTAINAGGSFDILLSQGDKKVEVTAESNLQEAIETTVDDQTLRLGIKSMTRIRPNEKIIVHISTPNLESVVMSGVGSLKAENTIVADRLDLTVSGSGKLDLLTACKQLTTSITGIGEISLSGQAEQLNAIVQGSGFLDAVELEAANGTAMVGGVGNIQLFVTGELDATITGSGNISYKGEPAKLKTQEHGVGKIRKMNRD